MAVTRNVVGWSAMTAVRVVMDAGDRVGVGLIMLSAIGIYVKSEPAELTGWFGLMAFGLVSAFFGGYAKHWCEAYLEEQQRELDAKEDEDDPLENLPVEELLEIHQATRDQQVGGTNP